MKNILLVILMGIFLSSCSHFYKKNDPVIIVTPSSRVYAPKVQPIQLSSVKWQVYNTDNLKSLIENSNKTKEPIVLFTLDEDNFKLLNDNLNDIKRYIQQKNEAFILLNKVANAPADAADAALSASVTVKDGKK